MRSLPASLYALLVFCSGALVGSVGYRLYMTTGSVQSVATQPRPQRNPEEFRRRMVEEMRTRLKLSDAQVSQLQAIYDQTKQRFVEYDQHARAERKAMHDAQHAEIRAILNDQQRDEYEKWIQERERHRREMQAKDPNFGKGPPNH